MPRLLCASAFAGVPAALAGVFAFASVFAAFVGVAFGFAAIDSVPLGYRIKARRWARNIGCHRDLSTSILIVTIMRREGAES